MGLEEEKSKEKKESVPFIVVDMDKSSEEDWNRLEELGWTKSGASKEGEMYFLWEEEGEPNLPEEMMEKVIGKIGEAKPVEKP